MKFPGAYAAYAAIMAAFGQTTAGIHLGLLIVNGLTVLLVFLLGRYLLDVRAGALAAGAYALLSTSGSVLGTAGHATHFVVLPAVAGLLLLLVGLDSGSRWTLVGSGCLLGVAVVMKQPGVFFVIFALAYLLWRELRRRPVAWAPCLTHAAALGLGVAIPLLAMCGILLVAGVFGRFWFWTVTYAGAYGSEVGPADVMGVLAHAFPRVLGSTWPLWLLAGVGLSALWWGAHPRSSRVFLAGFSLFSWLAVCPGFYFRNHYFILVLPAVALMTAVAVVSATRLSSTTRLPRAVRHAPLLLFLAALAYTVLSERELWFRTPPLLAARRLYEGNPFPESIEVSRYIEAHSKPDDRVVVLGSEPQIYFLSDRRSATGYIYTYGLMESQPYAGQMQREMIREVEAARPAFLVFVSVSSSWLAEPQSDMGIVDWARAYVAHDFDLVGVIDILPGDRTESRWGDDARTSTPRSPDHLLVYRRKGYV